MKDTEAYFEGFDARDAGKSKDDNPYDSKTDPDLHEMWLSGWYRVGADYQ